jgi:hypothetical protein
MKLRIHFFKTCLLLLCFCGCSKRNFFPDEDNPGLSILSSRGFNIATVYINEVPYINPYSKFIFGGVVNSSPTITKINTNSTFDTLSLSWAIQINDTTNSNSSPYRYIAILMPVSKSFTRNDLIAMSGQRFSSNSDKVILQSFNYGPSDFLSGVSNIYFVKINQTQSDTSAPRLLLSGLFNGNIGDSILITKGRFDFEISTNDINF